MDFTQEILRLTSTAKLFLAAKFTRFIVFLNCSLFEDYFLYPFCFGKICVVSVKYKFLAVSFGALLRKLFRFAARKGVSLMTFDNEMELHKVYEHYPSAR